MDKPLAVGRALRILAGVVSFAVAFAMGPFGIGGILLILLGISFVVSGIIRNPGCELTALPNLLLPEKKRAHCF
jgi:hypothetical protein